MFWWWCYWNFQSVDSRNAFRLYGNFVMWFVYSDNTHFVDDEHPRHIANLPDVCPKCALSCSWCQEYDKRPNPKHSETPGKRLLLRSPVAEGREIPLSADAGNLTYPLTPQ